MALVKELAKHIELKVEDAEQRDESVADMAARIDEDSSTDIQRDHQGAILKRASLSRFLEEVAPDPSAPIWFGSRRGFQQVALDS